MKGGAYLGDSTQLTYLRSRFYASGTGRFLTRDTWEGEYNRPLSLNRWMYTEGNPVNYTDPSGYIAEGDEATMADFYIDLLRKDYNVRIEKDWGYPLIAMPPSSLQPFVLSGILWRCGNWEEGNWCSIHEIKLVYNGVKAMSDKLGGAENFKSALWGRQIAIKRMPDDLYLNNYVAWTVLDIKFYNATFNGTDIFASGTVVHELAHVWDTRQIPMFNLSRKMTLETDSYNLYCTGGCEWVYDEPSQREEPLTGYGKSGPREDFAETFAICVYPGFKGAPLLSQYPIRKDYIEGLLNGNKCS